MTRDADAWWFVWNAGSNPSFGKAVQARSPKHAVSEYVDSDEDAYNCTEESHGGAEFVVIPLNQETASKYKAKRTCVVRSSTEKGEDDV